jgi:hypothetical protein
VAPRRIYSGVAPNDILEHPGVCAIIHHLVQETPYKNSPQHPAFYILKRPVYDEGGNRIGPVITEREFNEMLLLPNYLVANRHITRRINGAYPTDEDERQREQFITAVCHFRKEALQRKRLQWRHYRDRVIQFRLNKLRHARMALEQIKVMLPPWLQREMIYEEDEQYPYYEPPSYMPITPFVKGYCILIHNRRFWRILRPVLKAPSACLRSYAKRLFYAKQICQEYHAVPDPHYEATQM